MLGAQKKLRIFCIVDADVDIDLLMLGAQEKP